MSNEIKTTYFIVEGTVFSLREKPGETYKVYIGNVRGMTDGGQPGWSKYDQTHFKDKNSAQKIIPYLATYSWDFEGVENIVIKKITKIIVTTIIRRNCLT